MRLGHVLKETSNGEHGSPLSFPTPSFPSPRLAENVFHGFIALSCASVVVSAVGSSLAA
jgi:hypothetical protein